MSMIPPHYTDRYVDQRYNKALMIVQNLPASSSFQPTKEQKLELYALYKQVSHGSIDTQRPGIFDVVGRAKWDAWKKLEGLNDLEAKHRYVDTLLRSATEAYKKPVSKAQAQQIIQTFTSMQPLGSHEEDSDMGLDHDEESSIASTDAEEQAYLRDIQQQVSTQPTSRSSSMRDSLGRSFESPVMQPTLSRSPSVRTRPPRRRSWQDKQAIPIRPPSVASVQSQATNNGQSVRRPSRSSAVTPAATPRMRPSSSASHAASNERRAQRIRVGRAEPFFEETFDASVNPWVQQPAGRRYRAQDGQESEDSIEDERRADSRAQQFAELAAAHATAHAASNANANSNSNANSKTNTNAVISNALSVKNTNTRLSAPLPEEETSFRLQSPRMESSASSSVTATVGMAGIQEGTSAGTGTGTGTGMGMATLHDMSKSSSRQYGSYRPMERIPEPHVTTVGLGPATRRALEALQKEIVALNGRIDGLRQELVERDHRTQRHPSTLSDSPGISGKKPVKESENSGGEGWEGWRWVLKAAAKHAALNIVVAFIFILILSRRSDSGLINYWQTIRWAIKNQKNIE